MNLHGYNAKKHLKAKAKQYGICFGSNESYKAYIHYESRRTQMKKDKLLAALERIAKEVDEDPNVWKKEEEYYKKYGTLTEEDMKRALTI